MVDITHKISSLRKAIALAVVKVSSQATIDLVLEKKIPKGDLFEFSRAAGLLAVKKTSDVIPDCHPLPIEYTGIRHSVSGLEILVEVEVHTIYKTGVEVEAMHGAAVTALTMYDMLKPVDKAVEIGTIKLISKQGGKTSFTAEHLKDLKCAVIVCSDSVAAGKNVDESGKFIIRRLETYEIHVERYEVVPDDFNRIQDTMKVLSDDGFDLVIYCGGTGLSPRDNTPDALLPLIDKHIPGIMEVARSYGQDRTPYAMLSRGVAGFVKETLVLTLPGSLKGVEESMNAIFPYIFHIFRVAEGFRHS